MTGSPSLDGKTCVITGASSGLGLATATALAQMGARTVLVCRDRARGEAALNEIVQTTRNRDVELMLADLSSQAAIRKLADDFLSTERPLHVLVNNAGAINMRRSLTIDRIETTFAVNHLAYFLLTLLLLDRLKASAPARIVNVTSEGHRTTGIRFDDLGGERDYSPFRAYCQSKLANVLFTYELARRLDGSRVSANSVHPGAVATRLAQNNAGWVRLLFRLAGVFFRSPERGAATSVHLASAPDLEGVTGKYFADCKEKRSSPASYDEATARRLWDVSARMTRLSSNRGWANR